MDKEIEKFALHNAIKYEGKANPGAVLGQVFAEDPKRKEQTKELAQKVQVIVKQVNSLSLEEQKARLQKIAPELLEEKKEKKKRELPELPNVHGLVVTRIPPEPSKYLHLGHAMSFLINYMYAKKYRGKCILRLDDTNPEKAKKEYYDSLHEDLLWLRIAPDKTIIASQEMETFYKYAEILINKDHAYVCSCDKEKVSEFRMHAKICEHRVQNKEKNMHIWKEMLAKKYKAGDFTLRLIGEIDSTNAVMRDPILFRIVKAQHTLTKDKYVVWPTYDFETVVGEEITGVTHILRSNEFGEMRIELQDYIKDLLGFKKQEVLQYGRINIRGFETQGRVIREKIEKGEVEGWDDPRLMTLKALRRRGILPETFYELVLEVGLSPTATNMDWSVVASINRKIIDPTTKRYFFVKNPKKIKIENSVKEAKAPLHPEHKEMGFKTLHFDDEFYIQDDIEKGKIYRFMHLFNFQNNKFLSEEYDAELKAKIIHCVPVKDAIDIRVLMADGSIIKGKAEAALKNLKEGEIIQFERQFFSRLDNKEKMLFIYTHE
ncbi:MAG: Glutamate-tRNA ligase [archaeon GW2011_AR17]|nr:MAG: Glutamate-tRNA ligase [archaeon GW2011_AR17]HIH15000.1 glutamate--tRNA ligase [Nanoarchaeota archaeon]HIJ05344.1 glutamate--tRNA ligase [Nanoarchaeota archaeon]